LDPTFEKFFTLLEPGFFGESVLDSFLDWNKFLCFGESVLDSFLDWNKFLCFGESVLDSFLDWNKFLCLVKVF
jgi:hypothetical protein